MLFYKSEIVEWPIKLPITTPARRLAYSMTLRVASLVEWMEIPLMGWIRTLATIKWRPHQGDPTIKLLYQGAENDRTMQDRRVARV